MNPFPDIFQALGQIPHGWCTLPKAYTLASMVLAIRPDVSLEIGVYSGRSFFAMALAHKAIGKGVAWGIDAWDAAVSAENETEDNRRWWGALDHAWLYKEFNRKVDELGVRGYSNIIRAKSDDVEPPKIIDILHVDGSHTIQAVKDVERYACNVRLGGFAVCDDVHWAGGGVQQSVDKLKTMGFRSIYTLDEGEVFQRVYV